MNSVRSLLHPIFNSRASIFVRNLLGFKPAPFALPIEIDNISVSDLFLWRSDKDFSTVFRVADIPKVMFGVENSKLLLVVYNRKGVEISRHQFFPESPVLEIQFSDLCLEDEQYGAFSIFHIFDKPAFRPLRLTNRCYVGYQRTDEIPSFVHGNVLAQYIDLDQGEHADVKLGIAARYIRPATYVVQKSFSDFDYSELAFSNPLDCRAWFEVNGRKYELVPRETIVVRVEPCDIISIRSNVGLPRPLVFSYKEKFFDCHHG